MTIEAKQPNRPLPPVERVLDLVRRGRACDPQYDRSRDMQDLDARADEYTRLLWEIAEKRSTLESRPMDTNLLREINTLSGLQNFMAKYDQSPVASKTKEFLQMLPGCEDVGFDQGFLWARFLLSSPMYAALARCYNGAPMTH